jgi:hypothetical protein
MDPLLEASARALRGGDPLAALKRVALRDDAPALALRGIAMAQLGELARARQLLQRAARAFGTHDRLSRARCVAAEAEVALAARELTFPVRELEASVRTFEREGDRSNALHARLVQAKRALLCGQVAAAEAQLLSLPLSAAPARLRVSGELLLFETALRRGHTARARQALSRARAALLRAPIPALRAELERAQEVLEVPAARLVARGTERLIVLDEVERVRAGEALVVDACRRSVGRGEHTLSLARRPVLFALLCALAGAFPEPCPREALLLAAFGVKRANDSHRARLRVELGRLRTLLRGLASVQATQHGYLLTPSKARTVCLLAPPIESADASLRALLADGAAWSTSALALALQASQRTVQRSLLALSEAGEVRALGGGRSQRWVAVPAAAFATVLLLPGLAPGG